MISVHTLGQNEQNYVIDNLFWSSPKRKNIYWMKIGGRKNIFNLISIICNLV